MLDAFENNAVVLKSKVQKDKNKEPYNKCLRNGIDNRCSIQPSYRTKPYALPKPMTLIF